MVPWNKPSGSSGYSHTLHNMSESCNCCIGAACSTNTNLKAVVEEVFRNFKIKVIKLQCESTILKVKALHLESSKGIISEMYFKYLKYSLWRKARWL